MFETTFKNIDDRLHKDAGCSSELDYVEQSSWILFLKYLSELEKDKADEALLQGREYQQILATEYQWDTWACPKNSSGVLDHNKASTGDDLIDFVNQKLFPYLKKLSADHDDQKTIHGKISIIFAELRNKLQSGYTLRDVLNEVDQLKFRSNKDKHEMSHLYETKIKNMGNAGRNGGEYYTPRPLIRAMVQVTNPQVGETVYDGAVGSAGFLCEAFEFMKTKELTAKDLETLQLKTFYGKELKSLAYIIGTMNMILHGIESPNLLHTNTLAENINDIQEKDRYDVVLANPPFGGKIRAEIQQNFPIKTGETAYLFLQHFIKTLRTGGRGSIVIKNTFLSNTDNASISLRKLLLESCNLHTILDMPGGTFLGAGVKTVVLFFDKGEPTKDIWYYQLDPSRNMGKTNPLNDKDMADFINLQKTKTVSEKSWTVSIDSINQTSFALGVSNPNTVEEAIELNPREILSEIKKLDRIASSIYELNLDKEIKNRAETGLPRDWVMKTVGDVCDKASSNISQNQLGMETGNYPIFGASGLIKNISFYQRDKPYLSIVKDGSGYGRITKMDANTSVIGTLQYILPKDGIDLDYLYYNLISIDFKKYVAGAAIPHIYFKDYSKEPFLWMPLTEQRRIVAIIQKTFNAISDAEDSTRQKIFKLDDLKKSVLQKAFNGEYSAYAGEDNG